MVENVSDSEDVEHSDFGTSDEDVVNAGSSDVEMNLSEEEGIPDEQEVHPDVQESLDTAVDEGSATEYDNHKEAIEAATGRDNINEDINSDPEPEDFMMDEEEVDGASTDESNTDTADTEDFPETSSEEVGLGDGEVDFSALKSTEQVTETINRGGQEFEFVFEEPEGSDDEIINMVRQRQEDDEDEIDEAEVEAELRKEAVLKTLVKPEPSVVASQWDDFAGSVKLQLGGRALDVLGLMDFIRASGAGPELQQEG